MTYYPFFAEINSEYRLLHPDGSVAVFNNPFDSNYVGVTTEVSGLDSAEVRESADILTEADGGVHGNFYYGRRPIVISGKSYNYINRVDRTLRMDRITRASNLMRQDGQLVWKPLDREENSVLNPSGEVDLSGINTSGYHLNGGAGVARVTSAPWRGTTCYQVTASAGDYKGIAPDIGGYVNANLPYTFSVYLKGNSGGEKLDLVIAGADNAWVYAKAITLTTGWARYIITGLATSETVPHVAIRRQAGQTGGVTFYADGLMFHKGDEAASYFDGDDPNHWWQGTPHFSVSGDYIEMYTTVRRQQPLRITGAWAKDFQIALVSEYAPVFAANVSKAPGGTNAENRGSANAYPIFKISGAVANPKVVQTAGGSGQFKTTGFTQGSGDVFYFDMLNHTGYKESDNTSANRYIDFTGISLWPSLARGNNTFVLQNGDGSGSAATLEVQWRDAWV